MENLLSPSVELRALELINKGVDVVEAVKQALINETNMIGSLINSNSRLSERGKVASEHLFNRYNKGRKQWTKKVL